MVHLPHSGRSGDASCILLPSVKVVPMEFTMRLMRYHPDDRMIEKHLALLRIPDVPVRGRLVYAAPTKDTSSSANYTANFRYTGPDQLIP